MHYFQYGQTGPECIFPQETTCENDNLVVVQPEEEGKKQLSTMEELHEG